MWLILQLVLEMKNAQLLLNFTLLLDIFQSKILNKF